jgi:hypothetical protein
MTDWKPGDKAYLKWDNYNGFIMTKTTIAKVTKANVITDTGEKFPIETSRRNMSGDSRFHQSQYLLPVTPENDDLYSRQKIILHIQHDAGKIHDIVRDNQAMQQRTATDLAGILKKLQDASKELVSKEVGNG